MNDSSKRGGLLLVEHFTLILHGPELAKWQLDPFPKRHRLVHNGRFPNFEALYHSLNVISSINFHKTLVTRYNLRNHEVSNQFESHNGF